MAKIKIRRKRPVWPWIVLLVILMAAVVYFLVNGEKVNDDRPGTGPDRQMERGTASNFLPESETPFSVT